MTLLDLPTNLQERFKKLHEEFIGRRYNTAYQVLVFNAEGTRFFRAERISKASNWNLHFGGGSYWTIQYGAVGFRVYNNLMGERDIEPGYGKTFKKAANGTVIPEEVATKEEVLLIARAIGIFNI